MVIRMIFLPFFLCVYVLLIEKKILSQFCNRFNSNENVVFVIFFVIFCIIIYKRRKSSNIYFIHRFLPEKVSKIPIFLF